MVEKDEGGRVVAHGHRLTEVAVPFGTNEWRCADCGAQNKSIGAYRHLDCDGG